MQGVYICNYTVPDIPYNPRKLCFYRYTAVTETLNKKAKLQKQHNSCMIVVKSISTKKRF